MNNLKLEKTFQARGGVTLVLPKAIISSRYGLFLLKKWEAVPGYAGMIARIEKEVSWEELFSHGFRLWSYEVRYERVWFYSRLHGAIIDLGEFPSIKKMISDGYEAVGEMQSKIEYLSAENSALNAKITQLEKRELNVEETFEA